MDFLSQSFREYIKKIFNLNDAQTANETEGMHSVRECVTAAGAPFWSLKYLAESDYGNANMKEVACQIIDNIQPNLPKRLYIGGRGDSEKPLKIGIILEKRFTNVCISDIIQTVYYTYVKKAKLKCHLWFI